MRQGRMVSSAQKGPAHPQKESRRQQDQSKTSRSGPIKRSWPISLGSATALVVILVALSAVVNPLFGRYVHWDWMAVLAPTLLVLLTLALRRRWV